MQQENRRDRGNQAQAVAADPFMEDFDDLPPGNELS